MYQFSSIELDESEQVLVKNIKKLIIDSRNKYRIKGIRFNNKNFKGLRPNYGEIINSNELNSNLLKLSFRLSKKLNLSNPRLSKYNDLHSLFAVTWHRDDSSFAYPNPRNEEFYSQKKRILKFYIKTKFSFLDLMIRDKNNTTNLLISNNKKIGYFDVRNYHQTYIKLPFNLNNCLFIYKLTKILNKILIKINNVFHGFDLVISSNLYFVIYEDCNIFRDYELNEIDRSKNQIVY